eukprot:1204459-Alexandrium_andersonii.AAC.1
MAAPSLLEAATPGATAAAGASGAAFPSAGFGPESTTLVPSCLWTCCTGRTGRTGSSTPSGGLASSCLSSNAA